MSYQLVMSQSATRDLKKLDPNARNRIIEWLKNNIDGKSNPQEYGKALMGDLRGYWRDL